MAGLSAGREEKNDLVQAGTGKVLRWFGLAAAATSNMGFPPDTMEDDIATATTRRSEQQADSLRPSIITDSNITFSLTVSCLLLLSPFSFVLSCRLLDQQPVVGC